jgi:hypothetical protein
MIYIDALRDFMSHHKSFYISMVLALLACIQRSIRSLAILLTFIDRLTNKQIKTGLVLKDAK